MNNSETMYTATASDGGVLVSSEDYASAVGAARKYAWQHGAHTKVDLQTRLPNGPLKNRRTLWTSWEQGQPR